MSELFNLIDLNAQVKELNKALGESTNININNVSAVKSLIDGLEDFDGGIEYLKERLEEVSETSEEYRIILEKKVELEEEYAKKQREFLKFTGVNYKDNKSKLAGKGHFGDMSNGLFKKKGPMIGKGTNNFMQGAMKGIGGALSKALSKTLMKGVTKAVKGLNIATLVFTIFDEALAAGIEYMAECYEREQEKKMLGMQQEQNLWKAQQQARIADLDAGGKILTRNITQVGKTQQAVLSAVTAQLTQGAQEGAYAAAKALNQVGVSYVKNLFAAQMDILVAQNAAAKASLQATNENLKLQHKVEAINRKYIEDIGNWLGALFSSAEAATEANSKMADIDAKLLETAADIAYEKAQYEMQVEEKKQQIVNDAVNAAMEIAQGVVDQVLELTKSVEKIFNETEKNAKLTATVLGIAGDSVKEYTDFFFKAARNLKFNDSSGNTIYLDKDSKAMANMQSTYSDATGRNQIMGQDDLVKSFQLGRVLGDDNLAATLLGDMDYFNKSIAEGTDLIYEMFQQANKAGVSNKKFAKDLQKNLKMAQKYTFKGGIKGMMEMSLWAQKTRFNMESLAGVVEKGLKGGLEGVIQQSAKLQVLGGHASMLSNPLAMLYEFGNDPGAAAKRINEMTAGFGMFNSQTGEVDFSMSDNLHLRSIAEAYGMDPTELRNQATQRIKSKQIDKHITANYNDERKSLLYNKAQMDPETKKWFVTMANGEKRDINDIQEDEWAQLMPTEEAIEDYVSKIWDLLSQTKGAQNYSNQVLADGTKDIFTEEQKQRIDNSLVLVEEKYATTANLIKTGAEQATKSQKLANEALCASTTTVKEMFDIMNISQVKAIEQLELNTKGQGDLHNALGLVRAELLDDAKAAAYFRQKILEAADAAASVGSGGGDKPNPKFKEFWDQMGSIVNTDTGSWEIGLKDLEDAMKDGTLTKEKFEKIYDDYFEDKDGKTNFAEFLHEKLGWVGSSDMDTIFQNRHQLVGLSAYIEEQRKIRSENIKNGKDPLFELDENGLPRMKLLDNLGVNNAYDKYGMVNPAYSNLLMNNNKNYNNSMLVPSLNIKPINDGSVQLAKSHPQDSALFAKSGGPFDTLFNKVFAKVDAIYNGMGGSTSSQSLAPIQLNINGELNLKSGNQSVDLIGLMESNPQFVATMSQLIVTQLSKNVNGGKTGMFEYLRSI